MSNELPDFKFTAYPLREAINHGADDLLMPAGSRVLSVTGERKDNAMLHAVARPSDMGVARTVVVKEPNDEVENTAGYLHAGTITLGDRVLHFFIEDDA